MGREGINWDIGTDIYTLLYTKEITSKNLLCSRGNSTQYPVTAYTGEKKSKKKKKKTVYISIGICITDSLSCILKTSIL